MGVFVRVCVCLDLLDRRIAIFREEQHYHHRHRQNIALSSLNFITSSRHELLSLRKRDETSLRIRGFFLTIFLMTMNSC